MNNPDGNEPTDLDPCRGHTDDLRGHRYPALAEGENAFIGRLSGLLAENGDSLANGQPGGGRGPPLQP